MLKKTRQILAVASILMVTLLFADFTGTASRWFGWMAKLQFLPAFMALNVAVIAGLVVLTLLFGRLYCSVICPLGIM
ncbi:MAG: 4Fe-4S binding protein, partial [Muribaculaceae bacterium]|nr:4Fe-4S binding protein [Muribaculaceae bacterium]